MSSKGFGFRGRSFLGVRVPPNEKAPTSDLLQDGVAYRMLARESTSSAGNSENDGHAKLGYSYYGIQVDGEESNEEFDKCADLLSRIIACRQAYKSIDRGQKDTACQRESLQAIGLMLRAEAHSSLPASAIGSGRFEDSSTGTTCSLSGEAHASAAALQSQTSSPMDLPVPSSISQQQSTTSSVLQFNEGIFRFIDMKTPQISWEQYIKDIREVYGVIENGPCLSVARTRLTTLSEKFQLYSLLNGDHENRFDEYIKGGVYARGTKIDNALELESSVPAPAVLDYIVSMVEENPRIPLYYPPTDDLAHPPKPITLQAYLEQGGVKRPEEMTVGGLGLQPSFLARKKLSGFKVMLEEENNPSGKFGSTLLQCFLSMRGPNNGNLYGGLVRSDLERMEWKQQSVVCTERVLRVYGAHRDEVRDLATWIRSQGFHNFERNQWVLALGTHLPPERINAHPVTAITVEDQLHNLFYPLLMATLYPSHPEWKDIALLLQHTSAISIGTTTRARSKKLASVASPPSTVRASDLPSEYYYFYYYWSNFCTLNALRRVMGLNLLQFTSSVYEKAPVFDQLICSFLFSDVVYHARSLHKSWVMQYLFMMCRIGVVLSPLCDNLLGWSYFDHPIVAYFRQGMQVSLSTSAPMHYHHRVDQPLIEEYATLMKLHSLTFQDISEIARNSVLNSNFPLEKKQEWLGNGFVPLGSSGNDVKRSGVCSLRLQFRQEALIHEVLLLNMACGHQAIASELPTETHVPLLAECLNMPELVEQFKTFKRLQYVDRHVVYPRIRLEGVGDLASHSLMEPVEMLREVLLLRRKYIHSQATEVEVEDVFSHDHHFNESMYEYGSYYGVFVLSEVGKTPVWPSIVPTIVEFIKDMNTVRRAVTSSNLQRLCRHRLSLLDRKFLLHLSMNISNEGGKREEKEWNNRDFFTAAKVDNNVFSDFGFNARMLLEYFVDKVQNHGDDVVFEECDSPITLRQLISRYRINVQNITVDELNYQMTTHKDLRSIFLSPDNFMQGRYFAELVKQKLEFDKEDAFTYAEDRLRIHGASSNEWYMLADWFDRYGMASDHKRWMIALPRNYHVLHRRGQAKNFGCYLDHIFSALWEISLRPAKNTRLHYFLNHVSGFDCVAEESSMDIPFDNTFPHDWNTDSNPPYSMYMYYLWANIASLNEFRASRGLTTFSFRPQCGEFGSADHLISGFLLADSISHGVTLARHPVLEYLYYLTQLGVTMSPLSNTAGSSAYLENPFPLFFHRGLNVSLATNMPLHFHFTREPLIEEYSIAAKLWKFEFNDLSEIARNSVLQSGFTTSWKQKRLGTRYQLHSTLGNDVRKSRVSDIRVAFRFEAYHNELDFLDLQLGGLQRVPRVMRSLDEEAEEVEQERSGFRKGSSSTAHAEGKGFAQFDRESLSGGKENRCFMSNSSEPELAREDPPSAQRGRGLKGSEPAFSSSSTDTPHASQQSHDGGHHSPSTEHLEKSEDSYGSLEVRYAADCLAHEIETLAHQKKGLQACLLALSEETNQAAEELNAVVARRQMKENERVVRIAANLTGSMVEDMDVKSEED